mgnify:CR=1 FL=1
MRHAGHLPMGAKSNGVEPQGAACVAAAGAVSPFSPPLAVPLAVRRMIDVGFSGFAGFPVKDVVDIDIQNNDVIVGLASAGQSTYEQEYNSGLGSNGYTLARHGVLHRDYKSKYPETFAPELPSDKPYHGLLRVDDRWEGMHVGQLLLSPTRTYVPVLREILKNREGIHGIVHNSGGGQTKVLKFIEKNPMLVIKDNLLEVPPVFHMIQKIKYKK